MDISSSKPSQLWSNSASSSFQHRLQLLGWSLQLPHWVFSLQYHLCQPCHQMHNRYIWKKGHGSNFVFQAVGCGDSIRACENPGKPGQLRSQVRHLPLVSHPCVACANTFWDKIKSMDLLHKTVLCNKVSKCQILQGFCAINIPNWQSGVSHQVLWDTTHVSLVSHSRLDWSSNSWKTTTES